MINNNPVIFLCFSNFGDDEQWYGRQCRILKQRSASTITGFEYETESIIDSIKSHRGTRLANYRGFPLALGCRDNAVLEMFDASTNSWVKKKNYPFSSVYNQFSVVSLSKSVIYFGGRYKNEGWTETNIVAEFKNEDWSKIGEMAMPRSYHSSIQMNQNIFVFGGEGIRYEDLLSEVFVILFKSHDIILRNMEIWKNQGTVANPNYQRLDENNDFTTEKAISGEVMRIDGSQCKVITPSP